MGSRKIHVISIDILSIPNRWPSIANYGKCGGSLKSVRFQPRLDIFINPWEKVIEVRYFVDEDFCAWDWNCNIAIWCDLFVFFDATFTLSLSQMTFPKDFVLLIYKDIWSILENDVPIILLWWWRSASKRFDRCRVYSQLDYNKALKNGKRIGNGRLLVAILPMCLFLPSFYLNT